jgi:hypothetical protein
MMHLSVVDECSYRMYSVFQEDEADRQDESRENQEDERHAILLMADARIGDGPGT